MLTLDAHKGAVTTLDPHPTKARLLSASTDGMVRLWGTADEEEADADV
jgi:WD40 repeat protein